MAKTKKKTPTLEQLAARLESLEKSMDLAQADKDKHLAFHQGEVEEWNALVEQVEQLHGLVQEAHDRLNAISAPTTGEPPIPPAGIAPPKAKGKKTKKAKKNTNRYQRKAAGRFAR